MIFLNRNFAVGLLGELRGRDAADGGRQNEEARSPCKPAIAPATKASVCVSAPNARIRATPASCPFPMTTRGLIGRPRTRPAATRSPGGGRDYHEPPRLAIYALEPGRRQSRAGVSPAPVGAADRPLALTRSPGRRDARPAFGFRGRAGCGGVRLMPPFQIGNGMSCRAPGFSLAESGRAWGRVQSRFACPHSSVRRPGEWPTEEWGQRNSSRCSKPGCCHRFL